MRRHSAANKTVLAFAFAMGLGVGVTMPASHAGDPADDNDRAAKKEDGLRVEDLPKPVPSFMKTIQGIGNRVGKEISKATSKGAKAVKDAMKKEQAEGGQADGSSR